MVCSDCCSSFVSLVSPFKIKDASGSLKSCSDEAEAAVCRVVPLTLIHGPSTSAESQFATHRLVKFARIAAPGVKVVVKLMKQTHVPVGAAGNRDAVTPPS